MITNYQADMLRKRIRELVERTDEAAHAGAYPPIEANQMRRDMAWAQTEVDAYIKFLTKS